MQLNNSIGNSGKEKKIRETIASYTIPGILTLNNEINL